MFKSIISNKKSKSILIVNKAQHFISNKKATEKIWWIIATAAIAVIVMILILSWFKGGGTQIFSGLGQKIDEFGDCDKDKVANMFDQCPCISTKGADDEKFRGCPKGTKAEVSENDKKTCYWYADSFSADPNIATKECTQKSDCKTRCQWAEETLEAVSSSAGKGLATNGNLLISKLKFGKCDAIGCELNQEVISPNFGQLIWDLAKNPFGPSDSVSLNLVATVKNDGTENVPKNFLLNLQICDSNKNNCKPVNFRIPGDPTPGGSTTFDGLKKGDDQNTKQMIISLGKDGDACDTAVPGSSVTCFVKAVVDSADGLAESNETDNELGVFVTLKDQAYVTPSFNYYGAVELKISDNGGPDPVNQQIERACYSGTIPNLPVGNGYIGNKPNLYDCLTTTSCKFPYNQQQFSLDAGCLVVAWDDDMFIGGSGIDDCGYFGAGNGLIIPIINSNNQPIFGSNLKTQFQGRPNADNALAYFWTSKADLGSLICKDGWWHGCTPNEEGGILVVDTNQYLCQNSNWVPR